MDSQRILAAVLGMGWFLLFSVFTSSCGGEDRGDDSPFPGSGSEQGLPDTFIISSPFRLSNSSQASFMFDCYVGPCSFECSLDQEGFSACVSGISYAGLLDGEHNFQVRAVSSEGKTDPTPAFWAWTIDTIPPDTFISSAPANPSNASEVTFEFYCTGGDCTFECQLDAEIASPCSSPKTYTDIQDGQHSFQVRAIDSAFNTDPTPASHVWKKQNWFPTSLVGALEGRIGHSAVWTGTEMIIWGGFGYYPFYPNRRYFNTGDRYDPASDSWTWTSTIGAPAARSSHSAVWTGSVMIIWGGDGNNSEHYNDGGIYDPASDSWTWLDVIHAPLKRGGHSAVWTGSEMLIWGGNFYDAGSGITTFYNDGAKYNPQTDHWTPFTMLGAPAPRRYHSTVWTGTEMIIWGGRDNSFVMNTGAKYNPFEDSWRATSPIDTPSPRFAHAAVWTGSQMLVWGGYDGNLLLYTGALYDPVSDGWAPLSYKDAPIPREFHTAVWTGTRMIVWGGFSFDIIPNYLNTGGIYDPQTDSWTALSTYAAPSGRWRHTAVWTGAEMIVWGGELGNYFYNTTGGRYIP
jgi:N-acetylneuraminic acid mutarotase